MNKILHKIEKKILVSCQASLTEPFYQQDCMQAMIKSVINGGAAGLRLAGVRDIIKTRKFTDLPIIGITKPDPLPENWKEIVYITPTLNDAESLIEAGADIIAFDGTSRKRPKENLSQIINRISELNSISMADVSTLEEGIMCRTLGADIVSTTLSGYTQHTISKNTEEPDFELLENLVKTLGCPVILEGRIWHPDQVKKAFDIGAYSVVIGSAITRPQLITNRFVKAFDSCIRE